MMTRRSSGLKFSVLSWDRHRSRSAGTVLLKSVTMTGLEEPLPGSNTSAGLPTMLLSSSPSVSKQADGTNAEEDEGRRFGRGGEC